MRVYDQTEYNKIKAGDITPSLFVFYTTKPNSKFPVCSCLTFADLTASTGADDGFCVIDRIQRKERTLYGFTGNRTMSISIPFNSGVYVYGVGVAVKSKHKYTLIGWAPVSDEQLRPGAELLISVNLENIE